MLQQQKKNRPPFYSLPFPLVATTLIQYLHDILRDRNYNTSGLSRVLLVIIIIIIHFFRRVFSECTEAVATSLYHIVINFPEICAFIIGFSFTVWTKKSAKKSTETIRGCLQNLYQSVAIHLKYVLLVLL